MYTFLIFQYTRQSHNHQAELTLSVIYLWNINYSLMLHLDKYTDVYQSIHFNPSTAERQNYYCNQVESSKINLKSQREPGRSGTLIPINFFKLIQFLWLRKSPLQWSEGLDHRRMQKRWMWPSVSTAEKLPLKSFFNL